MSETTEFFVVLAAIYLAECAVLAPRGAVAFLRSLGSGWKLLTGDHFYGNPRWGIFFTHLVPELGTGFICELWPVSISQHGVYSHTAQAFNPGQRHEQMARFYRLDDVRTAELASRDVLVNGQLFVRTASPLFAERLANLIRQVARAAPANRTAVIDAGLRDALDVNAVRARVAEYEHATGWLGIVGTLLFIHLVMICPLSAWRYGLELTWLWLLLVLVVLDVLLLVLFHRAHRCLYRRWTSDRWSHLGTMLMLPLAAMRGKSFLSRHLLATHHPLAAARALCPDEVFRGFAASLLRDLYHPIQPPCRSEEIAECETEQFFRDRLTLAVERFLVAEGLRPQVLAAPPMPEDAEQRSYCARCHCQFMVPAGHCESCNLTLVAW